MPEILYFEHSELLAKILINQLEKDSVFLVNNKKLFLKTLYDLKPGLIIIGDTAQIDHIEVIFFLRSLPGITKIPIIYYGETEYKEILPINSVIPRNFDNFSFVKEKIIKCLNKSRNNNLSEQLIDLKEPSGLNNQDLIYKRTRKLLLNLIYQKNVLSELKNINISNYTFEQLLYELQVKLSFLIKSDFSCILLKSTNERFSSFYPGLDHRETVAFCLKNVPDSFLIKKRPTESINDFNGVTKFLDYIPSIIGFNGFLIIGKTTLTGNEISPLFYSKINQVIGEVISLAFSFNKKIKDTETLHKTFRHFLPGPIINDLLMKQTEKALMTGEKREIVVLFSHIRNFNSMIKQNTPEEIVNFLNGHFSRMVEIVHKHGGIVDKFIGDAVFAIFGAPISYDNNASRAAASAKEMIETINNFSVEDINLPEEGFSIGVGINEGEAIIGNIGSSDNFDFTAIGDTVNLAARLESLSKYYKQSILLSEPVYEKIKHENYCRLIDKAKVKGKNQSTKIYTFEIMPNLYSNTWKENYRKGYNMYSLGNWNTASDYFKAALDINPDDYICKLLLGRCLIYDSNPPENWNGTVTLDFK